MIPVAILIHIAIVICIYGVMAVGLNIIMGSPGLFSMAHHGLFGVGAYASALLALAGVPFGLSLLAGMGCAGLVSLVFVWPTLRMVGDYLAVCTMAMGEILLAIFRNWQSVTGGTMGVLHIPSPTLFGVSFKTPGMTLLLYAVILLLSYLVGERILRSSFGRVLKGIGEDEGAVQAQGKNSYWFKMLAFSIGGAYAGAAGSMYAHYVGYIDPLNFVMWITFFVWSMVILGGLGNNLGSVLAAAFFVTVRESTRFMGLSGDLAAAIQQAVFGVVLIVVIIRAPRGLFAPRKYITRARKDARSQ